MKNTAMQERLSDEISDFLNSRLSLNLSTIDAEGHPYASYAPFAIGDNCLYVLLSDVALHGLNLKNNPHAGVLVVEDEKEAQHLFARVRVNLSMKARTPELDSAEWKQGVDTLKTRHGEMVENLSVLSDFNLFKLDPIKGRYVKGFGKAFSFERSINGDNMTHLTEGHKKR